MVRLGLYSNSDIELLQRLQNQYLRYPIPNTYSTNTLELSSMSLAINDRLYHDPSAIR